MCGRYSLTKTDERRLGQRFLIEGFSETRLAPRPPRCNIAPAQEILAVTLKDGKRVLSTLRWGLVPSWVRDYKRSAPMINARMETLLEKPYFKDAFKARRCLIPADGFFEWAQGSNIKDKVPMYFKYKDSELFAFAGIWETWKNIDGSVVNSCSIITVPANELVSGIHERMPAILTPEAESLWLDEGADASSLLNLLRPYPASQMTVQRVSSLVNSPKVDSIECLAPAEEQLRLF